MDEKEKEHIKQIIREFLIPTIRCEVETRLQEDVYKRFTELEDRITELETTVMYKPILKSKMEETNEDSKIK